MFYDELKKAYEPLRGSEDYDAMYQALEEAIITNFPPKATCTKEYNERPIIIKQQYNAWKLFVEKELKSDVVWIGEDLYRDTIKRRCFKDEASAKRMFDFLKW